MNNLRIICQGRFRQRITWQEMTRLRRKSMERNILYGKEGRGGRAKIMDGQSLKHCWTLALALFALVLCGCSQRYGVRVLNRSTNDLSLLTMYWDGKEVAFPPVASTSADWSGTYGGPSADLTLYPRIRMPTGEVLVSYLTPGATAAVTNNVRISIPQGVMEAVRHRGSNLIFVVSMDNSITLGVSPDIWRSGPTSR